MSNNSMLYKQNTSKHGNNVYIWSGDDYSKIVLLPIEKPPLKKLHIYTIIISSKTIFFQKKKHNITVHLVLFQEIQFNILGLRTM